MKTGRHAKIIELIGKYEIETQEELAEYLKKEGFEVTQATVSRDIRKLKLTKVALQGGRQRYALPQPQDSEESRRYIRVLREGFVSMEMAQNILVVKTVAGMAMAVAAAIDAMSWQEVAGCIAGDDTIMCANRSTDDTLLVMEKIRRIVEDEKVR
ncbi:MAG: arginine repressor [Lachnospiraceae bacterium]|nr:arginine repressor [Lachnospiraceae bacterium]